MNRWTHPTLTRRGTRSWATTRTASLRDRGHLGDTYSYALAASRGEALLFKGNDFAATDIPRAL